MKVLRRVIFPVVWIVIFAVIAVALVKLAFGGGFAAQGVDQAPAAQLSPATLTVSKATISNIVELKAGVVSDPAAAILSSAAGKVVQLYVEPGSQVRTGDALLQVRAELQANPEEDAKSAAKPKYQFIDVLATSNGKLTSFPVLLEQQLSVGQGLGSIDPQSLSVTGTMDSDQQYRLLKKPTTATATVNSGPAPFSCQQVQIGSVEAASSTGTSSDSTSGTAPVPGAAGPVPATNGTSGASAQDATTSAKVSCKVPAGTPVFAGLGAKLALDAGTAKDVLAVPLSAVKGSFLNGVVWISQDGKKPEERKVELGMNDGKIIEVTKGLKAGELILQYVPGAPGAPGEQQAGMPGMVSGG